MNIVLFIGALNSGGAERQTVVLAKELGELGHVVSIVTLFSGGAIAKDLSGAVNVTHDWIWPQKGSTMWKVFVQLIYSPTRLREFLRGSDIIYSMLEVTNFISWAATRFNKETTLVWGIRSSKVSYFWKMSAFDKLCSLVSPTVQLIIANSNAGLRACAERGYRARKSVVVENGIDTDKFRPNASLGGDIRSEMLDTEHDILVGIVGNLTPAKDHSTFLYAAAKVIEVRKGIKFVCIGGGGKSYFNQLQKEALNLGISESVCWLGSREDMPVVYNSLDLMVSSSSSEGFSNVIGEAMACNIPCVVTDVGDSARILGDSERVVAPGDSQGLSAVIIKTLDADGSKVGDNLRVRIKENFSVHLLAKRTEALFRELL